MIDLQKLQEEMRDWQRYNFGDVPPDYLILGIMEELGELAHARLKLFQKIRHTPLECTQLEYDAIGDIFVYLINYCDSRGFNTEVIIETTWKKVKKRDWSYKK